MDATRVPAPPPATEGGPDAAGVIRDLRRIVANFENYSPDDNPAMLGWALHQRVLLRELDRLTAERAAILTFATKLLAGEDYASDPEWWELVALQAALAPRPAAPAAEGGGA